MVAQRSTGRAGNDPKVRCARSSASSRSEVAYDRDGHDRGRVVPVVEAAQILRGDALQAPPHVREGGAQPLDAELALPEIREREPARVERGHEVVEELARPGADLVLDRLPPAVHHVRVHLVRGKDAGQPLDGEQPVLPADGHVVPGVIAVGEAVAPPADPFHGVLDLLLGAAVVVGEEHVLGEVGELLLARRIRVGPHRHSRANRDVGRAGKLLEPDLDAVGEEVGLEAGERDCRSPDPRLVPRQAARPTPGRRQPTRTAHLPSWPGISSRACARGRP